MKLWNYLVLALVIALGLFVRFYDLEADPPDNLSKSAGAYFDGYDNAHSARSYTLFGELRPDGWDPILYAPPFVLLQILWFKLFAPSMWSINAFSAFFSTISFLIGIWCLRRFGFKALLMAAVLLGLSFPWVHFSRVAMFENIMIFFMALAMLCLGWEKLTPWRAVGVGAFAILAYASKATAIYFLPTAGFAVLLACWQGYFSQKEWKPGLAVLGGYVGGSLLALVPWLILFRIPDAEKIGFYGKQWVALAVPHTLGDAIHNFMRFRTFHYVATYDYLLWLGFAVAVIAVILVLIRPSKVPPIVLLWSFWLGGCILVAGILRYSPARYIIPAFLPAFCLAVYGITRWNFTQRKWVIVQWVVVGLLCIHFLDENAEHVRYAVRHAEHSIRDLNRATAQLPEGSVVAGISALFATADTPHTALRIDPRTRGWFNAKDAITDFGVTHLVLTDYGDNRNAMFAQYEDELVNRRLLSTHQVCHLEYFLYAVDGTATE